MLTHVQIAANTNSSKAQSLRHLTSQPLRSTWTKSPGPLNCSSQSRPGVRTCHPKQPRYTTMPLESLAGQLQQAIQAHMHSKIICKSIERPLQASYASSVTISASEIL
jgi:hypothetical protein